MRLGVEAPRGLRGAFCPRPALLERQLDKRDLLESCLPGNTSLVTAFDKIAIGPGDPVDVIDEAIRLGFDAT